LSEQSGLRENKSHSQTATAQEYRCPKEMEEPRGPPDASGAIKRIAAYREDVGRNIKEAGLSEHLVLLSLYQTCRFRKISFLKFLLSRERDLDSYSPGKRFRRRASL